MRNVTIIGAVLVALAACATGPGNQRATLAVTLTGTQEVPGPGDADGSGSAEIRVEPANSQLCWDLYARGIDPANAAHIHRGAEGAAGPVVVTLTTPDVSGHSQGCQAVDQALARELTTRAYGFYVNVHNAAHPAGAIRGQLRGGATRPSRQPAGR